jgi:hypothetical protein
MPIPCPLHSSSANTCVVYSFLALPLRRCQLGVGIYIYGSFSCLWRFVLSVICKGCIIICSYYFLYLCFSCFLYLRLFVSLMDSQCPVGQPCRLSLCVCSDCAVWVVPLKVMLGWGEWGGIGNLLLCGVMFV